MAYSGVNAVRYVTEREREFIERLGHMNLEGRSFQIKKSIMLPTIYISLILQE